MPLMVRKIRGKFRLVEEATGKLAKTGGKHKTRAGALAQMRAIGLSKARRKGVKGIPPRRRKR